jgi:mRNA export factor
MLLWVAGDNLGCQTKKCFACIGTFHYFLRIVATRCYMLLHPVKAIIKYITNLETLQDGQKVVGAGTDKGARLLDLGANGAPAQQVAVHDAPIKAVRFFEAPNTNAPMIATGSWDKTVKYWDLRQATPVGTLACQDRVYSMDVTDKLLVIGTADRNINIVNLNNPNSFFKTMQSPLKCQTRVVSCFNDAGGFAVGSIEGRSAFQWMDEKKSR